MGQRAHDERQRLEHTRGSTNARRRSAAHSTAAPPNRSPAPATDDDDDCEICRALRDGNEARALELIRDDPTNLELQRLLSLSDAEFDAWLQTQHLDLAAP